MIFTTPLIAMMIRPLQRARRAIRAIIRDPQRHQTSRGQMEVPAVLPLQAARLVLAFQEEEAMEIFITVPMATISTRTTYLLRVLGATTAADSAILRETVEHPSNAKTAVRQATSPASARRGSLGSIRNAQHQSVRWRQSSPPSPLLLSPPPLPSRREHSSHGTSRIRLLPATNQSEAAL
ncbi:hypothetical protein BX600DRAFT_457003 [Xylariales sp. PMI_506]|nr:hypothetical protein BX600DRAFT_457003 [Xylariales sp. PMI_506]